MCRIRILMMVVALLLLSGCVLQPAEPEPTPRQTPTPGSSEGDEGEAEVAEEYVTTLSDGKVTPSPSSSSETFEFSVIYRNPLGYEPVDAYVRIIGFKEHEKVFDELKQMSRTAGSIYEGAAYGHSTQLEPGQYCYYFYFNDGHGQSAYLPEQGYPAAFQDPEVYHTETEATDMKVGDEEFTCDLDFGIGPLAWDRWGRGILGEPYYTIEFRADREQEFCKYTCITYEAGGERTTFYYERDLSPQETVEQCLEECKREHEDEIQRANLTQPKYIVTVKNIQSGIPVPSREIRLGSDDIDLEEGVIDWLADVTLSSLFGWCMEKLIQSPQLWTPVGHFSTGLDLLRLIIMMSTDSVPLGETDEDGQYYFHFPPSEKVFVKTDIGTPPQGTVPVGEYPAEVHLKDALPAILKENQYDITLWTWDTPLPGQPQGPLESPDDSRQFMFRVPDIADVLLLRMPLLPYAYIDERRLTDIHAQFFIRGMNPAEASKLPAYYSTEVTYRYYSRLSASMPELQIKFYIFESLSDLMKAWKQLLAMKNDNEAPFWVYYPKEVAPQYLFRGAGFQPQDAQAVFTIGDLYLLHIMGEGRGMDIHQLVKETYKLNTHLITERG